MWDILDFQLIRLLLLKIMTEHGFKNAAPAHQDAFVHTEISPWKKKHWRSLIKLSHLFSFVKFCIHIQQTKRIGIKVSIS